MGTQNESKGLLSCLDQMTLRSLIVMCVWSALGGGLGGAVAAFTAWGWPVPAMGWVSIRGGMIGIGLGWVAIIVIKIVRHRYQAGVDE